MPDSSYNDRALDGSNGVLPKPQIMIMVDGKNVWKPSMESYFVEPDITGGGKEYVGTVAGSYCSCNTVSVCVCLAVCTCESVCSCVSHTTSHSGGGYTYCSCVPVH